jgi:signal transduction histidine kinase
MESKDTIDTQDEEIKPKPLETGPRRIFRILFLEDNPDDIEFMQFELDQAKISYISKSTDKKAEFLDLALSFRPHVILADYSLSTFNGVEGFKMLREEGLIIPYILVTGALDETLALECLKIGIDDFVLKSSFKRLPSAIISAIDKREIEMAKERMSEELKKSHEELRMLLHRHQVSLEQERMTIARDLHDELGQVLTALKMTITVLFKRITGEKPFDKEYAINEFNGIISLVERITKTVKEISGGLRPETLDALGILESIHSQASEFERRNSIACRTILPSNPLNIDKELSITIFRVVQESLTNVVRHAGATEVEVRLISSESHLFLEIKDNGKGISEQEIHSSKSLGLIGLRERVLAHQGVFTITGSALNGTMIAIMLPLKNDNHDKSSTSR